MPAWVMWGVYVGGGCVGCVWVCVGVCVCVCVCGGGGYCNSVGGKGVLMLKARLKQCNFSDCFHGPILPFKTPILSLYFR